LYAEVVCALLPSLDRTALELTLERLLSGSVDGLGHTFAIQAEVGPRWREVQITRMSDGASGSFVAIHNDLPNLATTQAALKVTDEQLLAARDDERQRIAIELHDSTTQHLVAIGLSVARLRRASRHSGAENAILDDISTSLTEAITETRVLSYLMKPHGLGQNGLSATARQFLEGLGRRTGLEVALEADGSVDGAPAPLQHAALRIMQEALLNVSRHARARRVSVELGVDDGRLRVSVTDDGQGMPSEQGEPRLGVGIPGMRARAQQFSGDLAILSDQSGTRVVALLPLG
jgi:signal transduction histidine kinase